MPDQPATDSPERPRAAGEDWASLASSLAAEKGRGAPPRGMPRAALASSLALLLAVVAVMVTGMLWWQYRQFYVSLDQTDAATAEALTRVRAVQRALQDRLTDAGDDIALLTQSGTAVRERLDALPGRFAALDRQHPARAAREQRPRQSTQASA